MTAWRRAQGWGVVDRPGAADHGGVLYAASLLDGVIHRLEGPAAVVARTALTGADLPRIRHITAAVLGVQVDEIDQSVAQELIEELVVLGLLNAAG